MISSAAIAAIAAKDLSAPCNPAIDTASSIVSLSDDDGEQQQRPAKRAKVINNGSGGKIAKTRSTTTTPRDVRLKQNREAAHKSRLRKKLQEQELRQNVAFYTKSNEDLAKQNADLEIMLIAARAKIVGAIPADVVGSSQAVQAPSSVVPVAITNSGLQVRAPVVPVANIVAPVVSSSMPPSPVTPTVQVQATIIDQQAASRPKLIATVSTDDGGWVQASSVRSATTTARHNASFPILQDQHQVAMDQFDDHAAISLATNLRSQIRAQDRAPVTLGPATAKFDDDAAISLATNLRALTQRAGQQFHAPVGLPGAPAEQQHRQQLKIQAPIGPVVSIDHFQQHHAPVSPMTSSRQDTGVVMDNTTRIIGVGAVDEVTSSSDDICDYIDILLENDDWLVTNTNNDNANKSSNIVGRATSNPQATRSFTTSATVNPIKPAQTKSNDDVKSTPTNPPVVIREESRKEKNRRAAREARLRKKMQQEELRRSVTRYTEANDVLKKKNDELQLLILQARSKVAESNEAENPTDQGTLQCDYAHTNLHPVSSRRSSLGHVNNLDVDIGADPDIENWFSYLLQ
eukprot:CAMPEP_0181101960 /NCGR_PEP_ID=MMETSP1071-20121207/14048_1 /TAXON_ID=35127 /ORGANISM="Thalassiosira sp., Strain NH16" /LENGTH=573 /DNA_ID=CAMNT_0023184877 /DNA_START=156 /DNA_END=1877 /DNA_ORIENTATION=+